jgi:hypothetical protein
MASRLRRRIPVIVSTRGSAAGVGATSWVGSTAPSTPEWLIPVATYDLGTFAPGASIPLTGLYTANGGTPYFTYVSGQTISGTSVTMTVDSADGDITAPTTQTTYTAVIDLAASSTAEQDWITRSTGAGVVWAHDFRYEQEFKQFHVSTAILPQDAARWGGTSYVGGNDPNKTLGLSTGAWVSSAGIGSSGAVQFTIPAGLPTEAEDWSSTGNTSQQTFWKRTSGTWAVTAPAGFTAETGHTTTRSSEFLQAFGKVGSGAWSRPYSAIPAQSGATGNGLPTADPAAPATSGGAATLTRRAWDPSNRTQEATFRGGYYGHSSYQSMFPAEGWDGSDHWLQMRVKFSASRWLPQSNRGDGSGGDDNFPPDIGLYPNADGVRQPPGKLVFFGLTGGTWNQEIVFQSLPKHDYNAGQGEPGFYTSQGGTGMGTDAAGHLQPGGVFTGTLEQALNPASWPVSLWEWSNNDWDTVLLHFIPGRGNAPGEANAVNTTAFTPTLVGSTVTFEVTPATYQPMHRTTNGLVGYEFYVIGGSALYHVTASSFASGRTRVTAVVHSGTAVAPSSGENIQFRLYNGGLWPNLPAPYAEFGLQIWAARRNESTYTKIWDRTDYNYVNYSHTTHPPSFNELILTAYMNNVPAQHAFTQSYTQLIFKKGNGGSNPQTDGIPCPQA